MPADDERAPLWSRRLTERRVRRDYSYAEVAHRLRALSRQAEGADCGVTARTVWRWEHGTRPLARHRRLLGVLYGASPEELGFRAARTYDRPGQVGKQADAHAPSTQVAVTHSTTPGAGRTAPEGVLQAFRDADRQLGGAYIYGAVIRYLTCEVAPQLLKSTPEAYAAAAGIDGDGRGSDCGRTLLSAERTLDRQPSEAPSPWISPFDQASLAAEASQCMQQLRQFAAARRHSERVIDLRDRNHVRSRAFSQLRLANILVSQGEIDHACGVAADALASSGQLSSHRVSQLLHSLYTKLLPHAAARGVEDAVEALSAALGARVPAHLLIDAGHDPEL